MTFHDQCDFRRVGRGKVTCGPRGGRHPGPGDARGAVKDWSDLVRCNKGIGARAVEAVETEGTEDLHRLTELERRHAVLPAVAPLLLAGRPVSIAQPSPSRKRHVRRAGSGRHRGPQSRAAPAQEVGEPVELRSSGADEVLVKDNVRRPAAEQAEREVVLEAPAQDESRHGVAFDAATASMTKSAPRSAAKSGRAGRGLSRARRTNPARRRSAQWRWGGGAGRSAAPREVGSQVGSQVRAVAVLDHSAPGQTARVLLVHPEIPDPTAE